LIPQVAVRAFLENVTFLVFLAAFGAWRWVRWARGVQQAVPRLCSPRRPPRPATTLPRRGRSRPDVQKDGFDDRDTFCADVPVDMADVMFRDPAPARRSRRSTRRAPRAGLEEQAVLVPFSAHDNANLAGRGTVHGGKRMGATPDT